MRKQRMYTNAYQNYDGRVVEWCDARLGYERSRVQLLPGTIFIYDFMIKKSSMHHNNMQTQTHTNTHNYIASLA